MYVIWSINKAAWVTPAYVYSSSLDDAKRFTPENAFEQCAKHSYNGAISWMPIRIDDLERLRGMIQK